MLSNDIDEFDLLKIHVQNLLGFNTLQYKDSYLRRRFDSRLRLLNLDSYHDYWEILRKDQEEQKHLLDELTINVTEFFRDNSVYAILQDEIFPQLIKQKTGKILIWSAGCSDGKEAYSIAMIAIKKLGKDKALDRVEILATDIDKNCLDRGIKGVYKSKPGLSQTDIARQLMFIGKPKYFFDIDGDIYTVKPTVRKLVTFQHHDLIDDPPEKKFDIIFCRNVVIYFKRELQETLYMNYYNTLNPGGFFIMGKTETLSGKARELFTPYNSNERIFIKI